MPTRRVAAIIGRCLICGTDLEVPVFDCPACATPHHSACWQWTGGCAVYGCARRPRTVHERRRDEELERVAQVAERQRRAPLPRMPSRPGAPLPEQPEADRAFPAPRVSLPAASSVLPFAIALMCAVAGASLDATHRSEQPVPRIDYRAMAAQVAAGWTPGGPTMNAFSSGEARVAQLLRDDALWGGTGTEPAPPLRRMMVMQEGEAVRFGLRQLARRDLPGWVRARLEVLLAVDREGVTQLLALRRP